MATGKQLIETLLKFPKGTVLTIPALQMDLIKKELNGSNRSHYYGKCNETSDGVMIGDVRVKSV